MHQKRWWGWLVFGMCVLASASARDSGLATTSPAPPSFFLQDASSDGLCLGAGVFQRCGVDTLWYVTGSPGSYSVHKRSLEGAEASGDATCLDRATCDSAESPVRLGHCRHCGAVRWNIVGDAERGYALTEGASGASCVRRIGDAAILEPCDRKHYSASTELWHRLTVPLNERGQGETVLSTPSFGGASTHGLIERIDCRVRH